MTEVIILESRFCRCCEREIYLVIAPLKSNLTLQGCCITFYALFLGRDTSCRCWLWLQCIKHCTGEFPPSPAGCTPPMWEKWGKFLPDSWVLGGQSLAQAALPHPDPGVNPLPVEPSHRNKCFVSSVKGNSQGLWAPFTTGKNCFSQAEALLMIACPA